MQKCHSRLFAFLLAFSCILLVAEIKAQGLDLAIANSTCQVMKQLGQKYTEETGISIRSICKSSGRLAKGIKGRAISADIYLSANQEWMEYIVKADLVDSSSVHTPWANQLVVAAPQWSPLDLQNWEQLSGKRVKTVMIGDPGTAPFGRYAKQALKNSGLWGNVKKKIVTKKHITILAEALGIADSFTVGILFRTNVNSQLKIFDIVEQHWHKPIRYYVAPLKNSLKPQLAQDFIQYLRSDEASSIFQSHGFIIR